MRAPADEAYLCLAETLCGPRKVVWVNQAQAETGEQAETWADWFRHRSLLLCSRAVMHVPSGTYGSDTLPPAPKYAEERAWLVLPSKCPILLARLVPPEDYSEPPIRPTVRSLPPLETASSAAVEPKVDVFFVHGNGYPGAGWNAAYDDIASGETVQLQAAAQLPAFHGLCRVHAPLYRVAADGAFFCRSRDDARRALDLAYADVRSAFEHFLLVHNQGRPFILAAHGQGGVHVSRLLEEVVEPRIEKLGPKLVCCYLISALTPLDRFHYLPHIPPSNAPDHLCCVAGWDVRGAEGPDVYPPPYHRTWPGSWYGGAWREHTNLGGAVLGTNPYTWRDGRRGGGGGGGSAANLGVCLPTLHNPEKRLPRTAAGPDGGLFSDGGEVGWSAPAALQRLRPLEAFPPTRTAQGGGGEAPRVPSGPLDVAFDPRTNWLVLPHLPLDGGVHSRFKPSPDGRLHDHAWSLFFYNLRENVRVRIAAWQKKQSLIVRVLSRASSRGSSFDESLSPGRSGSIA